MSARKKLLYTQASTGFVGLEVLDFPGDKSSGWLLLVP